jgi:hypothetical protein
MFEIIITFIKAILWPAVKQGVLTGTISVLEDQLMKERRGRRQPPSTSYGRLRSRTED